MSVLSTIGGMPKRNTATDKGSSDRSGDRHKPSRMMRIVEVLAKQLDKLAERNATSAAQEANRAIRELLTREELWPPREGK